jgi:hypothetical protein
LGCERRCLVDRTPRGSHLSSPTKATKGIVRCMSIQRTTCFTPARNVSGAAQCRATISLWWGALQQTRPEIQIIMRFEKIIVRCDSAFVGRARRGRVQSVASTGFNNGRAHTFPRTRRSPSPHDGMLCSATATRPPRRPLPPPSHRIWARRLTSLAGWLRHDAERG